MREERKERRKKKEQKERSGRRRRKMKEEKRVRNSPTVPWLVREITEDEKKKWNREGKKRSGKLWERSERKYKLTIY